VTIHDKRVPHFTIPFFFPSLVPQRISSDRKNITFHIHPEREDKINDERGAHCKERNVNEPCSDAGNRDAHFFTDSPAHTEQFPFDKIPQTVHIANLIKFHVRHKIGLANKHILGNFA
jgi:hypothetical protein